MKKKKLTILAFALIAAASVTIYAGNVVVTTTCGKIVGTTGPEGFPGGMAAYEEYLIELNWAYCNEYGKPFYREVGGDPVPSEP